MGKGLGRLQTRILETLREMHDGDLQVFKKPAGLVLGRYLAPDKNQAYPAQAVFAAAFNYPFTPVYGDLRRIDTDQLARIDYVYKKIDADKDELNRQRAAFSRSLKGLQERQFITVTRSDTAQRERLLNITPSGLDYLRLQAGEITPDEIAERNETRRADQMNKTENLINRLQVSFAHRSAGHVCSAWLDDKLTDDELLDQLRELKESYQATAQACVGEYCIKLN